MLKHGCQTDGCNRGSNALCRKRRSDESMKVHSETIDGIDIVTLKGRLVSADTQRVRVAMLQVVEEGHAMLVVDISQVTFIDSSGLSVLLSVFKAVRKRGGEMNLFGMTEQIRHLLELTRVEQVLASYADRQSAIEALRELKR